MHLDAVEFVIGFGLIQEPQCLESIGVMAILEWHAGAIDTTLGSEMHVVQQVNW
jgi:hypothetical protein